MPTYDYRCDACGHEMAVFQGIKEDRLKKCPECGDDKLRRLIGAGAGIIFKGSGFYETDYKRSRKNGADEKKSDSKPAEKKSDSKTESSKTTKKSDD